MNRHTTYFIQRVLSAATSAAVYVIADMLSQRNYSTNRNYHYKKTSYRPSPYQKNSYRAEKPQSNGEQEMYRFRNQVREKKE